MKMGKYAIIKRYAGKPYLLGNTHGVNDRIETDL
jgi:hypothetical protein